MSTIVVMPGGFHPFHAGHAALYDSARRAFPDAEVYVAATNDTSTRPFPFQIKEKLAKLAGVEPGHFVQVKSPFQAKEITAQYNPEQDVLIFVRSEKDADKPPQAGGVKKDGNPAYLQPLLGAKRLEPFSRHAYMAYLPTVEFGPGMTSATEIRTAWPKLNEKRKTALVMSLYPKTQTNPKLAATVVKMLDTAMGGKELTEFAPGGNSASSYYAVTANFVNEFAQQKQEELQDLIDAGWTKQDLAQAGTLKGQAADIAHFERVRDRFLKGLKPGFDAYLRGDTQMKDQLGEYWIDNDLPLNQDWEKIYGEPWGDDGLDESVAEASNNKCPPATQDISLNLKNRQKAINEYGYGPLNPDLPNTKFWMKKVNEWNLDSMEEAQQSLCGNCAAFDQRKDTLDCIAQGIDSDSPDDAEGVIDAGDLGYCKFLKFKCASRRTCDAWVTGGPLIDEASALSGVGAQNFVGGMHAGYQDRENQPVSEKKQPSVDPKLKKDPELYRSKLFAKQHYPSFSQDPEEAYDKWVQRGLQHSEEEDIKHNAAIKALTRKIADIERKIAAVRENADYLPETSRRK